MVKRLQKLRENLGIKGYLLPLGIPLFIWIIITSNNVVFNLTAFSVGVLLCIVLYNQIISFANPIVIITSIAGILVIIIGVLSNFIKLSDYFNEDSIIISVIAFFIVALLITSNLIIYSDENIYINKK